MIEESNVSSLQQHLVGGNVSSLETALNLEATVGFPYSNYKYYNYDWDSEGDYDKFIEFGSTAPSISGRTFDRKDETAYDTTTHKMLLERTIFNLFTHYLTLSTI